MSIKAAIRGAIVSAAPTCTLWRYSINHDGWVFAPTYWLFRQVQLRRTVERSRFLSWLWRASFVGYEEWDNTQPWLPAFAPAVRSRD